MAKQDFNNLYQIIAEEAVMGFITFNKKTGICEFSNKMANQVFELPFDFNIEELSIEKLLVSRPSSDPKITPLKKEMLDQEGFFQDIMISKYNGRLFIANLGIKFVTSSAGEESLLLMIQDTTIQKRLQKDLTAKQEEIKTAYEELLEQNTQLKELDVAKDRFIALTTHELRTPLSAMVASSEMLKLKLYDDEDQRVEFENMIYDEGQHLLELVNDILDFSKIQAGRMDYFVENLDLMDVAKSTVDGLKNMAETENIKIEISNPEFDTHCWFDMLRLKQVTNNIVNNAIKYNKENGSVKLWIEENDTELTLFVEDTGKGIPQEQVDKVFDEFETLGKVALHSKGTGLGMPISKRLIENMGGSINLSSEVGVGTKFWITIPKEKVLEEEVYRSRPDEEHDLLAA